MIHGDILDRASDTRPTPTIFHRDSKGMVHACHRAVAGPGKYLVWTDCLRDVPAERAFTPTGAAPAVTCPRCRERSYGRIGVLPEEMMRGSAVHG